MGILSAETNNLNNSVLNAYLINRFAVEYIRDSDNQGVPLPLAFIPVPLLINRNYYNIICRTHKNWNKFLSKFPSDNLTTSSLINSIESNYMLSQSGIRMAIKINLLTIDPKRGELIPLQSRFIVKSKLNDEIKGLCHQAEKLAKWSKEYSLNEIFSLLGVEL